jgi:hypothetical protein
VIEDQGRDPIEFTDAVAIAGSDIGHDYASVEVRGGVLPFGDGRVVRFPLAGVMGVAPATTETVHSVPPDVFGGNIDVNLRTVGSSLYLPVQVDEALFYVGDPHFAQGDGEVALTAMEASLRATFRFTVLRGAQATSAVGLLAQPFVETEDAWVPLGLDVDLDEALRRAVRAAIAFLHETGHAPPRRPRVPQRGRRLRDQSVGRRGQGRSLRDSQAGPRRLVGAPYRRFFCGFRVSSGGDRYGARVTSRISYRGASL